MRFLGLQGQSYSHLNPVYSTADWYFLGSGHVPMFWGHAIHVTLLDKKQSVSGLLVSMTAEKRGTKQPGIMFKGGGSKARFDDGGT